MQTDSNQSKLIKNLELTIPVQVISEANRPGREHWRIRYNRKKSQKEETIVRLSNALAGRRVDLPCVVTLIRVGPNRLDSDNLANSFKAIQDGVAFKIGVDDGDIKKITWIYDQEPTGKREYAVKIHIRSGVPFPDHECPACEREEKTVTPPHSSVVGSMPVHTPSGQVCMKYLNPDMIEALTRGAKIAKELRGQ